MQIHCFGTIRMFTRSLLHFSEEAIHSAVKQNNDKQTEHTVDSSQDGGSKSPQAAVTEVRLTVDFERTIIKEKNQKVWHSNIKPQMPKMFS